MNMKAAARHTLSMAFEYGIKEAPSLGHPECEWFHLEGMVIKMETEEMSEGKLGRWLGWLQASVVLSNIGLTLEDMKNINKRYA